MRFTVLKPLAEGGEEAQKVSVLNGPIRGHNPR
jgi:hypothetical protein